MSIKAQAFITLTSSLEGFVLRQNKFWGKVETLKEEGIYSYTYLVHYVLRRYAKLNHISDAIEQLSATRKHKGEI